MFVELLDGLESRVKQKTIIKTNTINLNTASANNSLLNSLSAN